MNALSAFEIATIMISLLTCNGCLTSALKIQKPNSLQKFIMMLLSFDIFGRDNLWSLLLCVAISTTRIHEM